MRGLKQLLSPRHARPGDGSDFHPAYATTDVLASAASERWLDERAHELHGEWTTARLATFSRTEEKGERWRALAGLLPLQEVRLQLGSPDSLDNESVHAYTMHGAPLGRLEAAAATFFREQSSHTHVVLGYVYEVLWRNGECTRVVVALVSWVPFARRFLTGA